VRVPPLRERRNDIPILVQHFLHLFAAEMKLPAPRIDAAALEVLLDYDYPGNVRELKNIAERALISSGGGPIEREHVQLPGPRANASSVSETFNVNAVKAQLVDRALEAARGNVSAAARLLGVHRSWLYRRR